MSWSTSKSLKRLQFKMYNPLHFHNNLNSYGIENFTNQPRWKIDSSRWAIMHVISNLVQLLKPGNPLPQERTDAMNSHLYKCLSQFVAQVAQRLTECQGPCIWGSLHFIGHWHCLDVFARSVLKSFRLDNYKTDNFSSQTTKNQNLIGIKTGL